MYERLFESPFSVALMALSLACLASALNGRAWLGPALMAFGYTSAFAAAFFLDGLLAPGSFSVIDMASGLAFEFLVLTLYCRAFISLRRQIEFLSAETTNRAMSVILLMQLAISIQLLSSEGFGLFSDGSRIDFLFAGAAAKYVTYTGVMLAALQAALLAGRVSNGNRLRSLDYATILLAAASSILSGSKGGFFLWALSALSLVNYRKAKFGKGLLICSVLLIVTLWFTVIFVAEFFNLDASEFAALAMSRFFLNNDARALALDLQGQASTSAMLLSESFRSIANATGSPPTNIPLGQLLYELNFGYASNTGANTSTMALIIFYSERGGSIGPTIAASVVAILVYASFAKMSRVSRQPIARIAVCSWTAVAMQLFTQDFLAFQLVLPLSILGVIVLRLIGRRSSGQASLRRVGLVSNASPFSSDTRPA